MTRRRLHLHRILTKSERQYRWRMKNRAKIKDYNAAWRAEHREVLAMRERARRKIKARNNMIIVAKYMKKKVELSADTVETARLAFLAQGGEIRYLPDEIAPQRNMVGGGGKYDVGE